jgi:hypothetical protein
MSRKICVYCGKRKNSKSFSKHRGHKDRLDSRCKSCVKKETKIRYKIRKKAPPVPNNCECCHKLFSEKNSERLDHCKKTKKFRGWACDKCNTGIGQLGDNAQGVLNALNYVLLRSDISADELPVLINGVVDTLNNLLSRQKDSSRVA